MEEWKEYKLGDVCTIVGRIGFRGYTHDDFVTKPADGAISLSPSNIVDGAIDLQKVTYISWDKYYESPEIMLQTGDVVLSKTGTIGRTAIIPELKHPMTLNPQLVVLKNIRINNSFLSYLLKTPAFQGLLYSITVGSVVATLSQKNLSNLVIRVPNEIEQQRISSFLKSLDDKIEVNRRINENLEQQAQALFKSWFVDFEPFKGGEFVESELGMIPKGWRVMSLNEVCIKITDGSHYSPKDNPLGTIPMLSVKDMMHNVFDYSSCKKIDEEEFLKMKANDCVPLKNDILVAKDGSYLKEIFICNEEIKQALLSSIAIFRPNSQVIYPELMLQMLRLPRVKKDVGDNYVSGSALPRIVLKDFKKYSCVVAPIEIQNKLIGIMHSINECIHNNEQESRRLASLRDTLLPRLMSGELKVNEIETKIL